MDFTAARLQSIDDAEPIQLREVIDDWQPRTMLGNMTRLMGEDWNDPAMSEYDE